MDLPALASSLASYIHTYGFLWRHHAVDFYTGDYWNSHFPDDWKSPMLDLSFEELLALAASAAEPSSPTPVQEFWPQSLRTFIHLSASLPLPRNPSSHPLVTHLQRRVSSLPAPQLQGMNGKKRHEVQIMAALIDHLLSSMEGADDEKHAILDLGAGQGYLDGVLAYEYGRVVVGVDDDTIQTCGAKRRSERIGRLYEKRGEGKGALYHVNRRVEVGESFARMLREVKTEVGAAADGREIAGEEGERWALCGLHTCGDLASASIEHFLASDAGLLVNVGCCYNRLSEDVDPSSVPEWESSKDKDHRVRAEKGRGFGYPLSRLFNAERETYHLGFTARTLGCQATSRWVPSTTATEAQTDSAAPSTSTSTSPADNPRDAYRRHFYRALLQHVIVSRGLMPLVGKRRRNPDGSVSVLGSDDAAGGEGGDGASGDNGDALIIGRMKPHVFSRGFARYARIALGRLGVDAEACGLSESDLTAYEAVFAGREKEIAVVWTLRAMMGSAIESLVLVDRVLYLRERGGEGKVKVELFPLFGLRDSPRNMVLVARKVLPGEKGDAVEGSRGVGDDASIIE